MLPNPFSKEPIPKELKATVRRTYETAFDGMVKATEGGNAEAAADWAAVLQVLIKGYGLLLLPEKP